jgi:hypothetical protein
MMMYAIGEPVALAINGSDHHDRIRPSGSIGRIV